jgi:hypothetical protein
VQLPNIDRAVIPVEKLRDYLLDLDHRKGGSKAALLYRIGYRREEWKQLESDIREQLLPLEAEEVPAKDRTAVPRRRCVARTQWVDAISNCLVYRA